LQAVRKAPDGWVLTLSEPRRSLEQNALLHSILSDISARRTWAGRKWDKDTWKRLLTAAWLRAEHRAVTVLPALDWHGVDVVYEPTHKMSKADLASLIEYISAWDVTEEAA
jgi:hypothetical protein